MKKNQIVIIAGAIALAIFLFFANTKAPKKESADSHNHSEDGINTLLAAAEQSLSPDLKNSTEQLSKTFSQATGAAKIKLADSLVKTWDANKHPEIAAFYTEQVATLNPNSENWQKAGERYYKSARFIKETDRNMVYQKAIACLEKSLELNKNNLDAKTFLGACYVEATQDPMKGITLLREVVSTDSTQINAQLNLAFFAIKSGQFDKAINRFNTILRLKPDYLEAYLFIADAYERTGDKKAAIAALERYIAQVDDATIKAEVINYVEKLKNG